jgi:hypothetical protein
MKTRLMIFCCVLLAVKANADDSLKVKRGCVLLPRNECSVGIEMSQSPIGLELMHYNKDQWQTASANSVQFAYKPIFYGLNARFKVKSLLLGVRFGIAPMQATDSGSFSNNSYNNPIANSHYVKMNQNQMMLSLSVAKRLKAGRFGFLFGAELPFYYFSAGDYVERSHHVTYYSNGQNVNYMYNSSAVYKMPSGVVYGIGGLAEANYTLSRHWFLGIGANVYFLKTSINKKYDMVYTTANASYSQSGNLTGANKGVSNYSLYNDAKFMFISNILPSFKVHYLF